MRQPARHLTNPQYVAGQENGAVLTQWMFNQRAVETVGNNVTIDLVFDGKLQVSLPGGEIGWAVGGQGRMSESRLDNPDPISNGTVNCPWPDGTTSANGAGSLFPARWNDDAAGT